jgi:8-oxo-dGTP pyrophosphatase MutT (NUDIX family)
VDISGANPSRAEAKVAKKAQQVPDIFELCPTHDYGHEAAAPNWGKTVAPPSPAIISAPPEAVRARHRSPFSTDSGEPSPLLAELMTSPASIPRLEGNPILEAGALACRRLKSGELSILLVSKTRSGKWGIPKGRLNGRLTFAEVAAKEAFEEAGIKGRVSPGSIAMYRTKKRTPDRQHCQIVEVWIYLIEVTQRLRRWPEKGKREIRWVSCETAARHLREPMLAEICHRLAKG